MGEGAGEYASYSKGAKTTISGVTLAGVYVPLFNGNGWKKGSSIQDFYCEDSNIHAPFDTWKKLKKEVSYRPGGEDF